MNGKLYLIPTPVGNLEDITFQAVRLLKEADVLLAEDTRHAARLLQHLEIDRKTHPHHQHNEHKALKGVIHLRQEGQERQSVVRGKSVSGRVELDGRRIYKKNTKTQKTQKN